MSRSRFAFARSARALALLCYPSLIIVSLWLDQPALRAAGLPLLAVVLVGAWPTHIAGRAVVIGSIALAVVLIANPALALWPPGLVCLGVAAFFALSLRPGQQPLIERFALAVHHNQGLAMPGSSQAWMHRWTAIWAGLLTLIGGVSTLLAIADKPLVWLIWIAVVGPLLGFASLVLEYLLRRRRFPEDEHWTLGRFLVMLTRVRPEQLVR